MRSSCAALAAVALLVLAGCGGSSKEATPAATTATATTTTSGKPARLTQQRQDRAERATKRLLSATTEFQARLTRCIPAKRRVRCVTSAARPAEAVVARSRATLTALADATSGGCSTVLEAERDRINSLTEDLRAMTIAARDGKAGTFTKFGANVQADLRVVAAASLQVRDACA